MTNTLCEKAGEEMYKTLLRAIRDLTAGGVVWYIVSPHVPLGEPDEEPSVYIFSDQGIRTAVVHPDHLAAFLDRAREVGLEPREVDVAEHERRSRLALANAAWSIRTGQGRWRRTHEDDAGAARPAPGDEEE